MIRFIVPALLLVLAVILVMLMPFYQAALWLLIPTILLILIAIWDAIQTKHSLRRNYPLIARFRWLFEDLRPYLRSYIVESDLDGRPFN
jgi:hypothetical protein